MMKIVSWNLNGLLSCMQHQSFAPIQMLQPDILCCQEIRTKQQMEVLDGYHHYWNPSQRDGYSGTLLLSREVPENVICGLGDEDLDAEGRVPTAEYDSFFMVNAYAPASQQNLMRHEFRMRWDEAFRNYLCDLRLDKPVIVCGDFNATRADIDIYPENIRMAWAQLGYASDERSGLESLIECGFTDAYRHLYPDKTGEYTWWSNRRYKRKENRGWRLDYFFVDDELQNAIRNVQHHAEIEGSDHCPVLLEVDV